MSKKVSCVMTTYRRFHCVERSIAMFLSQDCTEDTELIIYNTDTEYPLSLDKTFELFKHKIKVINNNIDFETKQEYNNVGSIRRDALTFASGDYYITWDDDDLFFPWNIRMCLDGLNTSGKSSWKPKYSFMKHLGHAPTLAYNNMEASILTKMQKIHEFGFDLSKTGAEHLGWLDSLRKTNDILVDENSIPGYCFYWADTPELAGHKQSNGNEFSRPDNFQRHKQFTTDFAPRPLTLQHIKNYEDVFIPFCEFFQQFKNEKFELYNSYIKPNYNLLFPRLSIVTTKPTTGRNDSFLKLMEILEQTFSHSINIIETGCIRDDNSMIGDGWSTINWKHYCEKTNSKAFVVDINPRNIEKCKKIVGETDKLEYYTSDSVEFIENFSEKIHLLYLDSFDYIGDPNVLRSSAMHSLKEVLAAWDKLEERCFILIDGVLDENWKGKGEISIPYLLGKGFRIEYFIDKQVLLSR
jgi:glycosyltransferase involved in cell wall biosynthesis